MLKTMKSKVAAGTAAVLLVGGGGVALGASDAGAKLKNWYDVQFGDAKSQVEQAASKHWDDAIETEGKEVDALIDEMENGLAAYGAEQTAEKGKNINAASRKYIDDLKTQREALANGMGVQFDAIYEDMKKEFENSGKEFRDLANETLKTSAGKAGEDARKQLKKELDATTAQAVKDLRETINYVKQDLNDRLDKEKAATSAELETAINNEITRLHGELVKLRNGYVESQKSKIQNRASELETAAKQELDKIVNNEIESSSTSLK